MNKYDAKQLKSLLIITFGQNFYLISLRKMCLKLLLELKNPKLN